MICRTGVVDFTFASANARQITSVATAFPSAKFSQDFRAPMLPGFRFLFAATMLAMSLLIFGLGAAALLRAAHESFASNSSWRAAPEVPFAQRPDTMLPVLATLRVDTTPVEKANDQATVTAAAVQPPEPIAAESIKNEQVAAVKPLETPPPEIAKPAELPAPAPVAETPPPAESASPAPELSVTETTTAASEPKMTVAVLDPLPSKSETAPLPAEPAALPPTTAMPAISETTIEQVSAPADSIAATRIATLGGPPVDILDNTPPLDIRMVKLPRARPDQSARPNQDLVRKRVEARRAMHRRRLALRARLLFQQQQQVSPFGQPQSFAPAQPRQ